MYTSGHICHPPEKHMMRNTQTWGRGRRRNACTGRKILSQIPRNPRESVMNGSEVSVHPAIGMQRDTRSIKLHVSVATPRQVHLRGRDQHQHGVGVPSGGSQIGRQRGTEADTREKLSPSRCRDKLACSKRRMWEGMTVGRR